MAEEFDELMSEYNTALNKFVEAQEKLVNNLRKDFLNLFRLFFKENPDVYCIIWNQYTPYFNDGDECVFTVGSRFGLLSLPEDVDTDEVDIEDPSSICNAWHAEDHELSFGYYGANASDYYSSEVYDKANQDFRKLDKALDQLPDEVYKAIFGDHVTVRVTKDGVETFELDHD